MRACEDCGRDTGHLGAIYCKTCTHRRTYGGTA